MAIPKLIDTHAHLDRVDNVADALNRAKSKGVAAVVAVGMDLASNEKALALAGEFPGHVFPALGAHPWCVEAAELDAICDLVETHIDACVAVGEIGLDYSIEKDKDLQRDAFGRLLRIAAERRKPVLTHSLGSFEDVFRMVKDSGVDRAVFHWYSGPVELAEKIALCGFHISATPAVEYSEKHREVIRAVPLESLLLETDCPVKYHEIPSEPATLEVTLREVAKLKGQDAALVAEITTRNAIELFGLPDGV
jgi:TatD DNase family protein